MVKNVFALIGVFVVCRYGYKLFDKHVRVPLERTVAEALADEEKRKA